MRALAAQLGGAPRKSSYTAKGWHAQLSKLTATEAGYRAAERAGLSVSKRTLLDWLAEKREPNKANQDKIREAYGSAAGRWPNWDGRTFYISGTVKFGEDVRDRGDGDHAPLMVEGASSSVWDDFRRRWEEGGMTETDIEDYVIDLCEDSDIGYAPVFPGTAYTVTM
jgi:hypothetical protein